MYIQLLNLELICFEWMSFMNFLNSNFWILQNNFDDNFVLILLYNINKESKTDKKLGELKYFKPTFFLNGFKDNSKIKYLIMTQKLNKYFGTWIKNFYFYFFF